jgi:hypothetical protein
MLAGFGSRSSRFERCKGAVKRYSLKIASGRQGLRIPTEPNLLGRTRDRSRAIWHFPCFTERIRLVAAPPQRTGALAAPWSAP